MVSNSKALRLCKAKFLERNIWTLVRTAPLFYWSCTVWISARTQVVRSNHFFQPKGNCPSLILRKSQPYSNGALPTHELTDDCSGSWSITETWTLNDNSMVWHFKTFLSVQFGWHYFVWNTLQRGIRYFFYEFALFNSWTKAASLSDFFA